MSKQSGSDARHAIIIAASTSHGPEGGGQVQGPQMRKSQQEGAGAKGKKRYGVIAFSF